MMEYVYFALMIAGGIFIGSIATFLVAVAFYMSNPGRRFVKKFIEAIYDVSMEMLWKLEDKYNM